MYFLQQGVIIHMKVILSRKGFDSSYGGYPSFVLPDKTMVTLPIPNPYDDICYADLYVNGQNVSLLKIMKDVNEKIKIGKWCELLEETKCHFDPDLDEREYVRDEGWRGCFGQTGIAQKLLKKHGIGHDDIFLFFGWFNTCSIKNGKYVLSKGQGKHMLYGYLQVDKVLYTKDNVIPEWLKYHPHAHGVRINNNNNCIYIARESLSWNKNMKGYGIFEYDSGLELTKDGYSRSKWDLPDVFKTVSMTYHSQSSWKDDYFQSACRGQEFIIEENAEIELWVKKVIETHIRRD